jgi:hypothetical protein
MEADYVKHGSTFATPHPLLAHLHWTAVNFLLCRSPTDLLVLRGTLFACFHYYQVKKNLSVTYFKSSACFTSLPHLLLGCSKFIGKLWSPFFIGAFKFPYWVVLASSLNQPGYKLAYPAQCHIWLWLVHDGDCNICWNFVIRYYHDRQCFEIIMILFFVFVLHFILNFFHFC